jgi:hypothetical protein
MAITDAFEIYKPFEDSSRQSLAISLTGCHHHPWSYPIFAVSTSLEPVERGYMESFDMDGSILKPIDFKRMNAMLKGITNPEHRRQEAWEPGFG